MTMASPFFLAAPQIHGGDVDLVLPHDGADLADHAGAVAVVQQQHVLLGCEIHGVIPQPDDARSAFKKGSGDQAAFAATFGDQGQDVGEGVSVGRFGLFYHDAHLLGDQRGIDHVDILIHHAVEQGRQAADGQRRAVVMGDVARIGEGQLFRIVVQQLDAEVAHDTHQVQERAHLVHQGQIEARDVDGVFQRLVVQVVDNLLGNIDGHVDLGLEGVGAQVRRYHQVLVGDKLFEYLRCRWLLTPDVKGTSHDLAGIETVQHGLFVDDAAAGYVEDDHAALHQAEFTRADHAPGLFIERGMDGDDVAVLVDIVVGDQLDTQVVGAFDTDIGVAGQNLAFEGLQSSCHAAADLADTDHAGGLAFQFMAGKGGPFPLAALQAVVGGRDVAAEGKQQRHGMFGGAVGVAEGGIDYDHPLGAGIVDIDVVDADAGPGNHLETRGGIQQGLVDGRSAAGDDDIVPSDDRQQFLFFQAESHIQLDARFLGQ
jgi:hypothetical protein